MRHIIEIALKNIGIENAQGLSRQELAIALNDELVKLGEVLKAIMTNPSMKLPELAHHLGVTPDYLRELGKAKLKDDGFIT